MELNTLYQNIQNNLNTMMSMQNTDSLKKQSANIMMLLEENKQLIKTTTDNNHTIYIITAIVSAFFAYILMKEFFPEIYIVLIAGTLLFSFIVTSITIYSTKYSIDSAILLIYALSQKGWTFSTYDSVEIWRKWSDIYPFINKGDMDDAIALRINGNYENFSFCYFEYDYTIEIEEEEEYEDSNGDTYYETEYYYEYYTESCIKIDVNNALPYIETIAGSVQSDAIKFSYIDLNERLSVYSSNSNKAISFFTPSMQRVFASLYRNFPYSNISIQNKFVFINFGVDLNKMPRSIEFDENLLSCIKQSQTANIIDGVMKSLLPILQGAN